MGKDRENDDKEIPGAKPGASSDGEEGLADQPSKPKYVTPDEFDNDKKVDYPDPDEGVGEFARPPAGG